MKATVSELKILFLIYITARVKCHGKRKILLTERKYVDVIHSLFFFVETTTVIKSKY